MIIIITKNYEELSAKAAEVMLGVVKQNPEAVLGLATGTTPLGLYAKMIADRKEKGTDYSQIRTVNLDEYKGLPKTHEQSYAYFMKKNLFDGLGITPEQTNIEDGTARDEEAECLRYDAMLEELLRDIQLLGLGSNGHIAFNEPGADFGAHIHVANLTQSTLQAKAELFGGADKVPAQGLTLGIADVMAARHILLVANGVHKAEIIRRALEGPITPEVPASVLQLHPNLDILLDEAAAQ